MSGGEVSGGMRMVEWGRGMSGAGDEWGLRMSGGSSRHGETRERVRWCSRLEGSRGLE